MGWTVPKAFQSLQLSASGLETDKTYTVTAGETENSVTITGTNTYEGERGFGGRGGFGRRGQGGGMGRQGDFAGQNGEAGAAQ